MHVHLSGSHVVSEILDLKSAWSILRFKTCWTKNVRVSFFTSNISFLARLLQFKLGPNTLNKTPGNGKHWRQGTRSSHVPSEPLIFQNPTGLHRQAPCFEPRTQDQPRFLSSLLGFLPVPLTAHSADVGRSEWLSSAEFWAFCPRFVSGTVGGAKANPSCLALARSQRGSTCTSCVNLLRCRMLAFHFFIVSGLGSPSTQSRRPPSSGLASWLGNSFNKFLSLVKESETFIRQFIMWHFVVLFFLVKWNSIGEEKASEVRRYHRHQPTGIQTKSCYDYLEDHPSYKLLLFANNNSFWSRDMTRRCDQEDKVRWLTVGFTLYKLKLPHLLATSSVIALQRSGRWASSKKLANIGCIMKKQEQHPTAQTKCKYIFSWIICKQKYIHYSVLFNCSPVFFKKLFKLLQAATFDTDRCIGLLNMILSPIPHLISHTARPAANMPTAGFPDSSVCLIFFRCLWLHIVQRWEGPNDWAQLSSELFAHGLGFKHCRKQWRPTRARSPARWRKHQMPKKFNRSTTDLAHYSPWNWLIALVTWGRRQIWPRRRQKKNKPCSAGNCSPGPEPEWEFSSQDKVFHRQPWPTIILQASKKQKQAYYKKSAVRGNTI